MLAQNETPAYEITFRAVVLSILLAILLAASNAFLALKIGILTSASIPAAVLSMGILRNFRNASILENNLVQTAASAGEAVAGGIVYTIPALVIINYWTSFNYFENFMIALIGGVIGVMFSIPIRRVLVNNERLRFPEGRAIAAVLQGGFGEQAGYRNMLLGGLAGGLIELCQLGFKVLANSWQVWFSSGRALFGFGGGFSAAMIGAGYLIGTNLTLSIFIGAVLGWLLTVPALSEWFNATANLGALPASDIVMALWNTKIRYIGIGAMLVSGLLTLGALFRPFILSIRSSLQVFSSDKPPLKTLHTEQDIPLRWVLFTLAAFFVLLLFGFAYRLPLADLALGSGWLNGSLVLFAALYVFIIGFLFSAITGYFSGMVGVTASPGSAIIIAGILLAALLLDSLIQCCHFSVNTNVIRAAEAITIVVGSIITGAAAIANDNIQDLKVGHILGATPWKQQVMLLLGVVTAAAVIPPIMQVLFNVYGIAGVVPRPGMDPALSLPAPPAAAMAAITQAVFGSNVPWSMLLIGAGLSLFLTLVNKALMKSGREFSVLGVAIGIYLPLASSTPLFIGGMISWLACRGFEADNQANQTAKHRGVLLACGLVAGAALMDVVLAVPFSLLHGPDSLRLVSKQWVSGAVILSLVVTFLLAKWFYTQVRKTEAN